MKIAWLCLPFLATQAECQLSALVWKRIQVNNITHTFSLRGKVLYQGMGFLAYRQVQHNTMATQTIQLLNGDQSLWNIKWLFNNSKALSYKANPLIFLSLQDPMGKLMLLKEIMCGLSQTMALVLLPGSSPCGKDFQEIWMPLCTPNVPNGHISLKVRCKGFS